VEYQLDDSITLPFRDNSVEPRLTVSPGDVVTIESAEPIGHVTPEWTNEDYRQADPSTAHALTGSIAVNGAQPGDALVVEILDMSHKGWGWSGHMPWRPTCRKTALELGPVRPRMTSHLWVDEMCLACLP